MQCFEDLHSVVQLHRLLFCVFEPYRYQPLGLLYPRGDQRQKHLSRGSYFSYWRCCTAFLSQLVAILNQPGNGTANSGGLTRSCHSQCLRPLSLRCQEPEGCHGYPQSFCHPPWHTHKGNKTQRHEDEQIMQLCIITFSWKVPQSVCET